jgi:hypothetical protein
MRATSKRPLIYESVTVIRIGVHPIGKKPDNTSYVRPLGSHLCQPYAKSLLGQNRAPGLKMKSWFLAIVRPGHHPGLSHSSSIKPPWRREVHFYKIVCWDQNNMVLNQHRHGLSAWSLWTTTTRSPPFLLFMKTKTWRQGRFEICTHMGEESCISLIM